MKPSPCSMRGTCLGVFAMALATGCTGDIRGVGNSFSDPSGDPGQPAPGDGNGPDGDGGLTPIRPVRSGARHVASPDEGAVSERDT